MKRILFYMLLFIAAGPQRLYASMPEMGNYCSAPPYVSRSTAPNIMIILDNSPDMANPAYPVTADYDGTLLSSDLTKYQKPYLGYFIPTACYRYQGTTFQEVLNTSVSPARSYEALETCPPTAPFRGNLMNWATMGYYDLLETVLIGGHSTPEQVSPGTNAGTYTLQSKMYGTWDKYYPSSSAPNCVFHVESGRLTILDYSAGSCSLLDSPPAPIAFWKPEWLKSYLSWLSGGLYNLYAILTHEWNGLLASASEAWEKIGIVAKAWAATATISVGNTSAIVGQPFSLTLTEKNLGCSGNDNWSITPSPPASWLTGPTLSGNKNSVATWTGTPPGTTGSPYTFSATVSRGACNVTISNKQITVSASTLVVDTMSLPTAQVGVIYPVTLLGHGGYGTKNWSIVSGSLPPGLTLSSAGVISGTPTSNSGSPYVFSVHFTDSATPVETSNTQQLSLTVNASSFAISTASPLPDGTASNFYSQPLSGTGGLPPYTNWAVASGNLPPNLTLNASTGVISGTLTSSSPGTYTFMISLTDSLPTTVSKTFSLTITSVSASLSISSSCPNPDAVTGNPYSYTMQATGGNGDYTWSATPSWLSIDPLSGILSGTAPNSTGSSTFTITVSDNHDSASATCTLAVVKVRGIRSERYTIAVDRLEEACTDLNGNDICDSAESFNPANDLNGNSVWDGKVGIFQQFYDEIKPKARWGLTDFTKQLGVNIESGSACIPAKPASSFYTAIQNVSVQLTSDAPLAAALYADMNYYAFSQDNFSLYDADSYQGCGNVDPIDDVPCRKNFVLIISSGSNLSSGSPAVGPFPQGTAGCNETNPLVQNACVGFNADLRNDPDGSKPGKQNVYTYVVSTTTDTVIKTILQQTAVAGGGANQFYDASDTSNLPQQLKNAINDILGRAASGTAVSVLTTSSRGIGSMVQAYFLPTSKAGPSETRDVVWTGYLQNLWIDPQDNLREDTVNDFQLKLDEDKVVKLFFDETLGVTSAATFNTDQNGNGGTLATCTPQIEGFSSVKYLWEAGRQLAVKAPDSRTLFTAKKVIQGSSSPVTFSVNNFTATTVGSDATFKAALNPDPDGGSYDASKIVAYIRGECLETGMTGNTDCGSTANNIYRDRRMVLAGGATNGNVWKLGDIISSTPRVFANTPLNTYHVDYGDDSYRLYISDTSSSSSYRNHSSMAFVGANDGVLHAFRVGFMQDTGLTAGIKALFKNFFNSTSTDRIGEEVWGYIPFNAFPYLKYLANTGYCHLYYNDLSVRLVDVSIGAGTDNATTTKTMNSWRTVLLGGMRFGGACSGGTPAPPTGVTNTGFSAYYAIDITDPENPVPMWEFSDADLGYAASYPAVIRTGDTNVNGNWYVTFGSGSTTQPKSETDIARTAQGYIYILNLKTGELVKKIPLGFAAIVGDVLAIDADKNYSSEEIYFGTSYKSGSTWAGKLMGIGIPNQDLSTWSSAAAQAAIVPLFADNYPMTASPDATVDTDGAVWVFAGSGKYYSDIDESDTSNQVFLGLKHKATGITYPRSTAAGSLDDKTNVTTTGTVAATTKECLYSSGTFTLQDVVTSIFATSPEPAPSTVGWFLSLTGGERVISRPLAVGGLADFLTYVPSSDPCSYGGNSKLYAVGYTTGVAPTTVAIYGLGAVTGTQGTGIGQSVTVHKGIALGPGAPPTGEAIIIPPPKEGQESLKKKIQVATGVIVEAENQPVTSVISKIVHWLKK